MSVVDHEVKILAANGGSVRVLAVASEWFGQSARLGDLLRYICWRHVNS